MNTLEIKDIGFSGLNTDLKDWQLPNGFLSYGINFRTHAGQVISSGGEESWSTGPMTTPGYIDYIGVGSSKYWLIAGVAQVYVFDGTNWTDISATIGYPSMGAGSELLWTSCKLGNIPVFNNPLSFPEYWSPQQLTQKMQRLEFSAGNTFQSVGKSFNVIRSHRNILFALGLTESGVDYPDGYRWSHPADTNGLPFSWDETDPSSLASRESLGGDGGEIIDGLTLRDSFVIYSSRAIDILDYVEGVFVFKRRRLSSTVGLLSCNCVVEVEGNHYFIGDGDIYINDGNKPRSILNNVLRTEFASLLNPTYYDNSYVFRNTNRKEIWFCIPDINNDTANVAYIYNYEDKSWAKRNILPTIAYASYGSYVPSSRSYDSSTTTYDSDSTIYDSDSDSPLNDTVVGIDRTNKDLVLLDRQNTVNNCVIERTGIPLLGHGNVTTINTVYPLLEATGQVYIQFGSQDYKGSPVRWKPEEVYDPSVSRKYDIRTTGELHCWRIRSKGNSSFSLTGFQIEFSEAGRR